MKKYLPRNVSGNAADLKNSSTVAPDNRKQDNKARVIDSAKAMNILRAVIIIAGFLLVLLFVVWLKN